MARTDFQHQFREILIDPTSFCKYLQDNSIHANSLEASTLLQEFEDAKMFLINRLIFLIEQKLTVRQQQIIKGLFLQQKTQIEVSNIFSICQTTVHKVLKGNIDYKNGAKRYGGAIKKLQKICLVDPDIIYALDKINYLAPLV